VPVDVIMPALGMAQETGKVVRWLRAEGDEVTKGDPLLEVETDKVTVEVEAPASGTLASVSASDGDDIPVGQAIAVVLAAGEEAPAPVGNGHVRAPDSRHVPSGQGVVTEVERVAAPRRPLASPKARRLAEAKGLQIGQIAGSGPNGAVVAADVERHVSSGHVLTPDHGHVPAGQVERVSSVWRVMAERTQRAWQEVPHFFLVREVDASRLEGWRTAARRREGGDRITHTDLLVRVVAAALREHPRVNASWLEGAITAHEDVNVGLAVATDDGLVVPVVHAADRLGLQQIARRRTELVEAARTRKLVPDDLQGGTFTISNLGMFGVDAFMAIVNAPQAAILSVGRITERPVVVDGAVVARPTIVLGLSFDHRVVDGAGGARFLDTLASLIEEPAGLVT
jgi:pyruvate dehydrogenase E2 component (dihydrolipoyllysine-residue acetyltransferase)